MKSVEVISARGHDNILAINKHTFEITKEPHLTKRGDCIIAVAANKSGINLSDEFKRILRKKDASLKIVIQAGNEGVVVDARGHPKLTLNHPADLVIRKSDYICERTLAIKARKTAKDFSRALVAKLQNPQQKVDITLIVEES